MTDNRIGFPEQTDKRYIKFGRCPIEPHKGERWEKLEKVDTSKPVVLLDYCLRDSRRFWLGYVDFDTCGIGVNIDHHSGYDGANDTFRDLSYDEWCELMEYYYSLRCVMGLALLFKQGDYLFTTFRAYTVDDHKFYTENKGKEFWIKEVD